MSLLKRKLILKIFLVVILKKYKTGLIIMYENYLIKIKLMIFFMRTLVVILKKYKTGLIIMYENYLIKIKLMIFFMRT